MWDSDSSAIEQLRKAYFEDLPSQMTAARDESERRALRDRQIKVRNLLLNGYGVPVEQQAACAGTEGVDEAIRPQSRDQRTTSITVGKKIKSHLVRPSAVAIPEKEESSLRQASVRSKILEEKKRSRQLSREEYRRAIAKLRSEYDQIATRLARTRATDKRGKLLERQQNIRHLQERGYRVSIK